MTGRAKNLLHISATQLDLCQNFKNKNQAFPAKHHLKGYSFFLSLNFPIFSFPASLAIAATLYIPHNILYIYIIYYIIYISYNIFYNIIYITYYLYIIYIYIYIYIYRHTCMKQDKNNKVEHRNKNIKI